MRIPPEYHNAGAAPRRRGEFWFYDGTQSISEDVREAIRKSNRQHLIEVLDTGDWSLEVHTEAEALLAYDLLCDMGQSFRLVGTQGAGDKMVPFVLAGNKNIRGHVQKFATPQETTWHLELRDSKLRVVEPIAAVPAPQLPSKRQHDLWRYNEIIHYVHQDALNGKLATPAVINELQELVTQLAKESTE